MNNSLICVDASIIVDRLVSFDEDRLQALWSGWIEDEMQLVAPQLLRYEVTNMLYQIAKKARLSKAVTSEAIQMLIALPIKLYDDPLLHEKAFGLAQELALGATYDAHYLTLARHLNCQFWTRDAKLARAAQPKYDWVRLLDYERPA